MAAKVKCFKKFKRKNQKEEEKASRQGQARPGSEAARRTTAEPPILANKWKQIDGVATMFRLTDHAQIFFTSDGTSIVLSYDGAVEHGEYEFRVLTYIKSKDLCVNMYLEDVMQLGEEEEIY